MSSYNTDSRLEDVFYCEEADLRRILACDNKSEELKNDVRAFFRNEPPADAGPGWLRHAIALGRTELIRRLCAQGVRMDMRCLLQLCDRAEEHPQLAAVLPMLFKDFVMEEPLPHDSARALFWSRDMTEAVAWYIREAVYAQANAKAVPLGSCIEFSKYGMRFDDPHDVEAILDWWHTYYWHESDYLMTKENEVADVHFLMEQCADTVALLKLKNMYWAQFAAQDEFPADPRVAKLLRDGTIGTRSNLDALMNSSVDIYSKALGIELVCTIDNEDDEGVGVVENDEGVDDDYDEDDAEEDEMKKHCGEVLRNNCDIGEVERLYEITKHEGLGAILGR